MRPLKSVPWRLFSPAALASALIATSACDPSAGRLGANPASSPGTGGLDAPPPSASSPGAPRGWVEGVAAYASARKGRSPMLLYLSSTWCPPCRALEANVLSKPELVDAARGLALVKISGDAEGAQALVETVGARSYPTLLVLSADGDELFRAQASVSLDELAPALAAAAASGGGVDAARGRLQRGAPTKDDCALFAALDWSQARGASGDLRTLERAFDGCPDARTKAALASRALGLASVADEGPERAALRARADALLDAVFLDADTIWAARTFVSTYARPVCSWLEPRPSSPSFVALRDRWLGAAKALRERAGAPLDVWTRSHQALVDLHRLEHPAGPLPAPLAAQLVAAATRAASLAKTPSERHATLGDAAFLLRAAGEKAAATAMLEGETARSDDPGHDLVTLSEWASADGDVEAALRFARQATERAHGRPSRLQWIAHEVSLLSRAPGRRAALLSRASDAYALLFEHDDGFLGRNRVRAGELRAALEPLRGEPQVRALVLAFEPRCASLREATRAACREHFEGLRGRR